MTRTCLKIYLGIVFCLALMSCSEVPEERSVRLQKDLDDTEIVYNRYGCAYYRRATDTYANYHSYSPVITPTGPLCDGAPRYGAEL